MNKEDKEIQEYLVDEMMKVSKTNPDVMIYMSILMKKYEELEKEIERLKEEYVMLQNASDEVEEEKDKEIERLNKLKERYQLEKEVFKDRIDKALSYLRDIGNWLRDDSSYRAKLIDILQGDDKEC